MYHNQRVLGLSGSLLKGGDYRVYKVFDFLPLVTSTINNRNLPLIIIMLYPKYENYP